MYTVNRKFLNDHTDEITAFDLPEPKTSISWPTSVQIYKMATSGKAHVAFCSLSRG